MGSIIMLAFGACFFPTLLACVAIMISRPEPRGLLIAFYLGGVVASVGTGCVVLAVFKSGDAVLGSTRSDPHPTTSIVAGLVALVFAWLMASAPGHGLLDRWRSRRRGRSKREAGPSRAERRLGGASWRIALLIGAVINLPGPLYLLALGKIARGGYSTGQQVGLVLLFNAIMFLLLEVPLAGYLVRPEATGEAGHGDVTLAEREWSADHGIARRPVRREPAGAGHRRARGLSQIRSNLRFRRWIATRSARSRAPSRHRQSRTRL